MPILSLVSFMSPVWGLPQIVFSVGRSKGTTALTKFTVKCRIHAKQKHLGCKKVRGQSEATLQTGMCDQKL